MCSIFGLSDMRVCLQFKNLRWGGRPAPQGTVMLSEPAGGFLSEKVYLSVVQNHSHCKSETVQRESFITRVAHWKRTSRDIWQLYKFSIDFLCPNLVEYIGEVVFMGLLRIQSPYCSLVVLTAPPSGKEWDSWMFPYQSLLLTCM